MDGWMGQGGREGAGLRLFDGGGPGDDRLAGVESRSGSGSAAHAGAICKSEEEKEVARARMGWDGLGWVGMVRATMCSERGAGQGGGRITESVGSSWAMTRCRGRKGTKTQMQRQRQRLKQPVKDVVMLMMASDGGVCVAGPWG
jgi:hypothetical protein